MFSKRPDGNLLKNLDPFSKIVPYIMYHRNDATNMMFEEVDCRPMDEYIRAQAAAGVTRTYMQILIASMVRTMYQRPQLNRFVIGGKTYQRNSIVVSFVVHRSLRGTSEETTIKLHFRGDETLAEIADKIAAAIDETVQEGNQNATDKLAKIVTSVPYCIIWFIVKFLSLLDRHNLMPGAVVEASPFHSSFFITNLKSLGIDTIFHHIYNFGTTSPVHIAGQGEVQSGRSGQRACGNQKNSAARHCDRRAHLRRSVLRAFDQAYEKVHPSPGHAGRASRAAQAVTARHAMPAPAGFTDIPPFRCAAAEGPF